MSRPTLIVFSHLRWGFVYQRPQHLATRFVEHWDVLFVEEPIGEATSPYLEQRLEATGLTVLVPHVSGHANGFSAESQAEIGALLVAYLARLQIDEPMAWLYTPMALPLAMQLSPEMIVYDCMDELAAFAFAPPRMVELEQQLLQVATVVLTGGPSLYESKRRLRADAHCFPSSVEGQHYAPAMLDFGSASAERAVALQAHLPRPRVGFFGVIDERIDLGLIATLAAARPSWQIVMVGPIAKIEPADLPQAPNLHWLGMQPYDVLPYLLSGWDVCIMPFARNAATRFISPTKTLEYMAGNKPVVSTNIEDVRRLYGEAVEIASGSEGFVTACQKLLDESASERGFREVMMARQLRRGSWSKTARQIVAIVEAKRQARAGKGSAAIPYVRPVSRVSAVLGPAIDLRGLAPASP